MLRTPGALVNRRVTECGVVPLVSLDGRFISFFPRDTLPMRIFEWLKSDNRRPSVDLRDFCVSLGRETTD